MKDKKLYSMKMGGKTAGKRARKIARKTTRMIAAKTWT